MPAHHYAVIQGIGASEVVILTWQRSKDLINNEYFLAGVNEHQGSLLAPDWHTGPNQVIGCKNFIRLIYNNVEE